MQKRIVLFSLLGILLLSGCHHHIRAAAGEYIDAVSDTRPRTLFYLAIPSEAPYEYDSGWLIKNSPGGFSEIYCPQIPPEKVREYLDNGFIHKKYLDCRIVILYRRNGEIIWPVEYTIEGRFIGDRIFGTTRWVPGDRLYPVIDFEDVCLLSPEENDELLIFAVTPEQEIRSFTRRFADLPDFDGQHHHRPQPMGHYPYCILDRGPFARHFAQKIIRFPAWDELTPATGEEKEYIIPKLFIPKFRNHP